MGIGRTWLHAYSVVVVLSISTTLSRADESDWRTNKHEPGYCAMYGICGHRADGDVLNCPNNTAAQAVAQTVAAKLQAVCPQLASEQGGEGQYCCTEEQIDTLQTQIQRASIFLVGCPACNHNFKEFFCSLTCSPDQSVFTNVTAVQAASDNNVTSVQEVEYFLANDYGERFYNSCKDVIFSATNQKAMQLVGGGAKTFQEWVDFLGTVKDKRWPPTGSPFQMNFPGESATPSGMKPMDGKVPPCWDSNFRCSCGDCQDAPNCSPPPPAPTPQGPGCTLLGFGESSSVSCLDVSLTAVYLAVVCVLVTFTARSIRKGGGGLSRLPLDAFGYWGSGFASRKRQDPPLVMEEPSFGSQSQEEWDSADDAELGDDERFPRIECLLRNWFRVQGRWCAQHPLSTLVVSALAVVLCALGLLRFQIVTDPERLWVGPKSQAAKEKSDYEASFGKFYRIEQLILSTTMDTVSHFTSPSGLPAIVTDANIRLMFQMQAKVDAISASVSCKGDSCQGADPPASTTLEGICFKPLGDVCAIESVLQYWQMSLEYYTKGLPVTHTRLSPDFCFGHWTTQCRSAFQAPMDPHIVLGGFPTDSSFRNFSADATAFVVTYPVDSSPSNRDAAMAWEAQFLELAKGELSDMAREAGLKLSFSTERSIEDELARESTADVSTVAVSYVAMFVYIAVALGGVPKQGPWWGFIVCGRAGLGLGGVAIVASAVVGALGLCSLFGMWSTLIIMEVIPFLVLAVGVDNMFILAHAMERQPVICSVADRAAEALASAGPSITLAAACEVLAFGLAALAPMPAVRNFSICAALAVALDFVLQVTAFVALLALDERRIAAGRVDCAPYFKMQLPRSGSESDGGSYGYGSLESDDEDVIFATTRSIHVGNSEAGVWSRLEVYSMSNALRAYMSKVHAPLLLKPLVQCAVLAAFSGLFLASLAALPQVSRGLEQQIALPRDSYLQGYFKDVFGYLRVGAPLMFVVRDLNMSAGSRDVNAVCSSGGCDDNSLLNQVNAASRVPSQSYIAAPAASWLDDFLSWMSPEIPSCCRMFEDGSRCPPPDQAPCKGGAPICRNCSICFRAAGPPGPDLLVDGRPNLDQVRNRLPWFLNSTPSVECAKGGAGAYNSALQMDDSGVPFSVAGLSEGVVEASSFRTYYVPLNKQSDFVDGLQAVRDFTRRVSTELGLDIYPYSVFHIFFEQYLTIQKDAVVLLGGAAGAVFLVCWLLTGSAWGAGIILGILLMVLVDMGGAMWAWGVQLNALSLVNLTMALGIGVEFCAHLVHAFSVERGTAQARASAALSAVGASVLSGITLTKFIGVVVLAFARTQIFEVYFFRVYFSLVILGALHGLILLPVLLALVGPPPFHRKDVEEKDGLLEEHGPNRSRW